MKTAIGRSRARRGPDSTVAKIDPPPPRLRRTGIVRAISSTSIFTATSAPDSAHRINAVGPASSRNSFSNKASSEQLLNNPNRGP